MLSNDQIDLESVGESILQRLDQSNRTREKALGDGRQIIRLSANAIRAIHRDDLAAAEQLSVQASELLQSLLAQLSASDGIRWAGYVQDAMKEYAEARITLAIVANSTVPDPALLGIDDAPYLNGLAESASELRRLTLDALRTGELERAERYLSIMDEVYGFLVTVDYPDGLTGGLRRSTDALRAVLERTRGDLTITSAQNRLHDSLQHAIAQFSASD